MTAATLSFRPDGSLMDLANLSPDDISWPGIAGALSKLARFNGTPEGPAYSVGQHCVMGADALYRETGDGMAAGYFVLHDAHEALIGDMVRPRIGLIEHHAGRRSGIRLADATAKGEIDAVIYQVARIIPLAYAPQRDVVMQMDERMWIAEARALFGPHAEASIARTWPHLAALPAPRLTGAIKAWGPMKAEEAWLDRLKRYVIGVDR